MDGVLWTGETPMNGFIEFFATLEKLGIGYALATNNAGKTQDQYVHKFARLGVEIEAWRVVTSAEATGLYLSQHYPAGTKVYVIGGDGIFHALKSRGFDIVNLSEPPKSLDDIVLAELVVVGLSSTVNYSDFAAASIHLNHGARFIGTNPDSSFPSEWGILPGAGSLIKLIEVATGKQATIIGKPYATMYEQSMKLLNGTKEDTFMLGDRINTDIMGANKAGLQSIMVLSGISTREEAEASDSPPTYIIDDIAALTQALIAAKVTS